MRKTKHPIAVLGLPLDSLTASEAVDAIEGLILSGGTHQVATANLDFWLNSLADQHLHRIIAGCSLVLPDGMPLVWASGLLGCPLAERVTGVDLVPRLAELSARRGYGIFLLGGKGDVAERAAKLLEMKLSRGSHRGHVFPQRGAHCAAGSQRYSGPDSCGQAGYIAGCAGKSQAGKVDLDPPQAFGRAGGDGRGREL